jgi:hypothetical protein
MPTWQKVSAAVREDQRNVPNRWQVHLPRIRRIRQLITPVYDDAESLGQASWLPRWTQGIRRAAQHRILDHGSPWTTLLPRSPVSLCLSEFLAKESYADLASRTQRILQSTFEHSGDLWALVYTILGRLDPPSYEFELDCNFRTSDR